MRHWLFALGLLLATASASACKCLGGDAAGFIHASLDRLPANARGALFQLPPGSSTRLSAAAFTIVSDRDPAPLKAAISWPRFGIRAPGLLRQRMLARVGPVGGFQPGARYTITYHGKAGDDWRYPTRTEFTIDDTVLDVGSYELALAGEPARRLLPLDNNESACTSNQAAIVAEFAYRIPANYAPYRSAMIYAAQERGADGTVQLVAYQASLCEPWTVDAAANRGGRDLVYASCEQPGSPVTVRGHAGLLEVEDELQPTNDLVVDFNRAAGSACNGAGMLSEAIARADTARIKDLACTIAHEQSRRDAPAGPPPPLAALLDLAGSPAAPPTACMYSASLRWMGDFRLSSALLGPYLSADLQSRDEARIATAAEYFDSAVQGRHHYQRQAPDTQAEREALVLSILPAAVQLIVDGSSPHAAAFATELAPARAHIAPYLPALLDAAGRRSVTAIAALHALAQLAPDDPRVHTLLQQAAAEPALMETAALLISQITRARDTAVPTAPRTLLPVTPHPISPRQK